MHVARAGPGRIARRSAVALALFAVLAMPTPTSAQDQICITTRTETVTVYRVFGVEVWRTVTITSETQCNPA